MKFDRRSSVSKSSEALIAEAISGIVAFSSLANSTYIF
jgi:hypothetical protein